MDDESIPKDAVTVSTPINQPVFVITFFPNKLELKSLYPALTLSDMVFLIVQLID